MRSTTCFRLRLAGVLAITGILVGCSIGCRSKARPTTPPTKASSLQAESASTVARVVRDAIRTKHIPGCVVLVGTSESDLFRAAFGNRSLKPNAEPMTVDTIFDLASLTKSIATAPAIMLLQQDGTLTVSDPVAKYIPCFTSGDKQRVTIEHLLLHTSGLPPGGPLAIFRQGREHAIDAICALDLRTTPGKTFRYSDLGYILLGEIVERVTGEGLDAFVRDRILDPLGMNDSGFRPPKDRFPRIAPSNRRNGKWIRGQVHDPSSFALGGVAGHAGLFATADDLARYVRMILNGGTLGGHQIFKPETVSAMTRPRPAGEDGCLRAYGWDVSSPFSAPRGYGFELGRSFGHTGFTGTSIWIDPDHDGFVILLADRLHPAGKGNVIPLRRRLGTIVARALSTRTGRRDDLRRYVTVHRDPSAHDETNSVLPGIDVLRRMNYSLLKNRRVGLIANHTSRSRDGTSTIELLHAAANVRLVAIFSPEHGLAGKTESPVGDEVHESTGLKVYSLYGETKRPTPEMLADLDVLVFDIQDIGTRFYTYVTTMRYAMEAAAAAGIRFVVLDRPNPITGTRMFGPIADEGRGSFTCPHPLPLVHGLTAGELGWLLNRQRDIRADLHVVAARGWRRAMWFDQTGLPWIDPSPNIRNLAQATLYPAVCLLERTNVSVGRGTPTPFEWFGAPWIDNKKLASLLEAAGLAGVVFEPIRFTPKTGPFAGENCSGLRLRLTDRREFDPSRTGIHLVAALEQLHGNIFEIDKVDILMVSRKTLSKIKARKDPETIVAGWSEQLANLKRIYGSYRIYE